MTDARPYAHPEPPVQVRWLVRLRWAAIAAQIVSIFGVQFLLRAPFPLAPLAVIVGLLVVSNLWLSRALTRGAVLSPRAVTGHLLLDIFALTALLIWTGGAMNPFTTLYLLQVALAAILVPRRLSLVVAVAAAAAFGGLLLARPEAIHVWHSGRMFLLHVRGMWLAFVLTAASLWYFVDRVTQALQARESELAEARMSRARAERLAALGTLAAGTAHELNTPLGTVAILAAELSDQLGAGTEARAQADRIRAEVKRCAAILSRMRSHDASGESPVAVDLTVWLRETVDAWRAHHDDVTVDLTLPTRFEHRVRAEGLRQAVGNLLDNARLATLEAKGTQGIEVSLERQEGMARVSVIDHGTGIPEAVRARLGEPFFTTREPGSGLGLGLFLVEATVSQHRGELEIESAPGRTRITMVLRAG